MWFCHLTSRTTAFLVCNTVSVSWKVREQNPEPPSTKKHKANKRLFFTLQVFYSAWKSLEGASVPTGEQILAIHLCWDKRELRGSGFHLSRSTTALLHGNRRQPGGREWSGYLVSEQDKEVLPCEDCSVRGEGDPGQQAASKSVRPCRGKAETQQSTLGRPLPGLRNPIWERPALMGANVAIATSQTLWIYVRDKGLPGLPWWLRW